MHPEPVVFTSVGLLIPCDCVCIELNPGEEALPFGWAQSLGHDDT